MNNTQCQVLVVGAGPTGLVLAAELLARGIDTRIIDKGDGVVLQTRALGMHARTLEVLDLMGLADRLVERGQPVHRFQWYSDGKSLGYLDLTLIGSRFGYMLSVPQHETELLLRTRVAELGGAVEPQTELIELTQDDAGVAATVKRADGKLEEIAADYVVGCDGAHSRARHSLGLTFDGHAYDEDWLLADVQMDWNRAEDEVHAFFRSSGAAMICFPMRNHVWRIVLPYSGDRGRRAPTLEEIQQLVDQRAPERVVLSNPTWLANFRCSRRSTDVYRRGRIMLAGDAVHVHSPAGGQGMNTGIMDAHNLAWKLALVASGRSEERLLDTYGEERLPVAEEVLALTHTLVRVGTLRQPFKRALRDLLVPIASRLAPLQRRAVRRFSQKHVNYRASSLTRGRRGSAGLEPGDPAPEIDVLSNGKRIRLYEALRGTRHVMVAPSAGFDLGAVNGEFDVVVGSIGNGRDAWLVRPDGYIAARGTSAIAQYSTDVFRSSARGSGYAGMRDVRFAAGVP